MISGICESPLTMRAIIEWREALSDGQILLRDVIDLDATYGREPGAAVEGGGVPGAPGAPGVESSEEYGSEKEAAEGIDPDFTRKLFTPEEATAFVVGKTVILEPLGGAYYAPNFTLIAVWNGVRQSGTWSVNEDGGVCWHLAAWGVEPCRYYYYRDDVLMNLYKDKDWRAEELMEGNVLNAF